MKVLAALMVAGALGLGGCAARMQVPENQQPIAVSATSAKKVVLNLDGSATATGADSWSSLTSAFQDGCREEASAAGVPLEFQQGAVKVTGEAGTLVALYVNDFRYISTGARIGLGVMTGNAFIDANARFLNLDDGALLGERPYSTKSTAWQGIMAAMTAKQAQAICKNMLDVVRNGGSGK